MFEHMDINLLNNEPQNQKILFKKIIQFSHNPLPYNSIITSYIYYYYMFLKSSQKIKYLARKIKHNLPNLSTTNNPHNSIQQNQNSQSNSFIPLTQHTFKKNQQKIIKQIHKNLAYEGEDHFPNKLVNRMQKGVVWGLGGQLLQYSRKLKKEGIDATIDQIRYFLQQQQTKDVYVHDFGEQQKVKKRYSIVASAYSNRHCFKVGIELKKALDLGKNKSDYPPLFIGRKQDEWVLVQFKDFNIHIMTQSQREDSNLEWKWNNPVSQEINQKFQKMQKNRSRRLFQPLQ